MKTGTEIPKNIDEYIAQQPVGIREQLEQIREVVRQAAPEAEEMISYMMPTFKQDGVLVHFAAFKNHIGLYPAPRAIEVFKKELSVYKGAKGTVQFPLDEPLPLELIRRIVEFRVKENSEKAEAKKGKKPKSVTPNGDFLSTLSAPARRALEANGITTVKRLAEFSEKEILALHGVGKASLPTFRAALDGAGLSFKK
ncbi:MAG: DUF1801 domain-containing protein [Bacteroidota bacterium]